MMPSSTADTTLGNGLFSAPPTASAEAAQRRLARELSQGSRTGSLLLLLSSSFATVGVAALWLTEEGLPLRTRVAFGLLTAIGLAWSIFFGWVLTRRQLLFAYHRVVAGRLAVAACSVFTGGALLLAFSSPGLRQTGLLAAALGGGLVAAAVLLLRAARRRHGDLLALRSSLEAALGHR